MLMIGLMQFALLMLVAEFLYPGYSSSLNYISDLGAGPEPSRMIFTVSVVILGVLAIAAGYLYLTFPQFRWFGFIVIISGIGAVGVGLFNEDTGSTHVLFSFIAFFFAATAALQSSRSQKAPLSALSILLGAMSIGALALYGAQQYLGLGAGGMERMIFYPVLIWGLIFTGSIISQSQNGL